jgi:D-proline reductase (dithiol) PrdB
VTDAVSEVVGGRSELPPADYIAETRRLYDRLGYEAYRWAGRPDPPPWTPIDKPLTECRLLLIGSGGIYRHGQVAFHTKDDTSIRLIRSDAPSAELRTAHFAYDQTDARRDPNCVFPLEHLRELVADHVIAGLTENAVAFMGGIYSTRRLESETAPAIVEHCRSEQPDVVLLVPV